jgi:hypothetical protein
VVAKKHVVVDVLLNAATSGDVFVVVYEEFFPLPAGDVSA